MKNCKNIRLMFIKGPLVILTITKGLLPKTILSKKTVSRFLSQKKVVEKVLFSFIFLNTQTLAFLFLSLRPWEHNLEYTNIYTQIRELHYLKAEKHLRRSLKGVTLFESRRASANLFAAARLTPENEYVPEPPSFRPRSNQWSYPSPAYSCPVITVKNRANQK